MIKIVGVVFLLTMSLRTFATPEISIKEKSFVDDKTYFNLEDIAGFSGLNAEQEAVLRKIQIDKTPKYGDSIIFSSGRLSQVLRKKIVRYIASTEGGIRLVIPSHVRIENRGMGLTSRDLEPVVLTHLKSTCPSCDFRVNQIRMPDLEGLDPATTWELQFSTPLQHGTINANLIIREPQRRSAQHWLTIYVAKFQNVPVARRVISIGDRIVESDFRFEWRDVTHATDAIPQKEEMLGSLVKMGVALNGVIYRGSLSRPQAVNRGELVKVISGSEAWSLSVPAVAQQSGFVGDMIRLTNPTSQRIISGQIISRGVVKVE